MANTGPTAWNAPDFYVGRNPLNAYEPYPFYSGSAFSSVPPNNNGVVHWVQPQGLQAQNVVIELSVNAGVPGATSQASTGSLGYTYANSAWIYGRQDYVANSATLSCVTGGSFGMTATLGYSSTSQQFGLSWVTDTAGGAANVTTTSNDAGWSAFATAAKVVSIPLPCSLSAGDYWMIFQHSSSSATSNSNVTLMSVSQLLGASAVTGLPNPGFFGLSVSANSMVGVNALAAIGPNPVASGSFAISKLSYLGIRNPWFAMSNA